MPPEYDIISLIFNLLYGFDMAFRDILYAKQVKIVPKCDVESDILVIVHKVVSLRFFHFRSFSQTNPTFPKVCGYVSYSFIQQTKPATSYYHHLKYEPDPLTHARDKCGVKSYANFVTPCSNYLLSSSTR